MIPRSSCRCCAKCTTLSLSLVPFPSLSLLSLSGLSLGHCWHCVFLVFVFQMGLQPPVVVLVQVLDIEPTIATAAVAAERLVARGAEEMEEEEEHRHPRRLGALLFRSQETRDHKSAPAWSTCTFSGFAFRLGYLLFCVCFLDLIFLLFVCLSVRRSLSLYLSLVLFSVFFFCLLLVIFLK